MPKRRLRSLMVALLALVVIAVLAKIVLSDQAWPDSRALGRGIFIVVVFGAVPLVAGWRRHRRQRKSSWSRRNSHRESR